MRSAVLKPVRKLSAVVYGWLDGNADQRAVFEDRDRKVNLFRLIPFWGMHLMCLGIFWAGTSPSAVAVAVFLYLIRMFAITGGYHRYFSHRTFKTGRAMQFLFALIGSSATQRGALHWAAHHRHHHRFSDQPEDAHSPRRHGFWKSHMLWFSTRENSSVRTHLMKDFARYPELLFLDRFDFLAPVALGFSTLVLGFFLNKGFPGLHTSGMQMLVWGYFISTIFLYHGTFCINSMAHVWGWARFKTGDDSSNNPVLALITLGEGWHNNHHHYPNAVRQGFRWWEIDVSFYVLWGLSKLGLVWDLKPVPSQLKRNGSAEAVKILLPLGLGSLRPPAIPKAVEKPGLDSALRGN